MTKTSVTCSAKVRIRSTGELEAVGCCRAGKIVYHIYRKKSYHYCREIRFMGIGLHGDNPPYHFQAPDTPSLSDWDVADIL